jgi:hypothetical protein
MKIYFESTKQESYGDIIKVLVIALTPAVILGIILVGAMS